MSWHCLPELVEEYSAGSCSDGVPCAPLKSTPSVGRCYSGGSWMDAYLNSLFGTISEHSMGNRGKDSLMSFQEASRAKHGAVQRGAEIMARICGRKCLGLWAKSNLKLFSPKTWTKAQSSWLRKTLPIVDIKPFVAKFQRQTWAQTIIGQDGGYLHTPTTKANYSAQSMQKWDCCRNFVAVFGEPNPTNQEYLMGWPTEWTDLEPLETAKFQQWLDSHGVC